jgi:hypothetical protein
VISKLAEDNLSDDSEDGIGGTFTIGNLDSLSDEGLLLRDCREGFLRSPGSMSVLFNCMMALSGRLPNLLRGLARLGVGESILGEVLSSASSTLAEWEGDRYDAGGDAATGSTMIDTGCCFSGEVFRDLASFLVSFSDGEGDLEDDVFHGLLAKLRKVLETERPGEGVNLSVTPIAAGLLASFAGVLKRSSAESVNFVTATFPFPPLEALRSSALLGTYGEWLVLGEPPTDRAKTLSEKVRLMP